MWRCLRNTRGLSLNSLLARVLFVIVLVAVSALFFTQNPPSGPAIQNLDKVVHFCLFFVLAASMHYAFRLPYWLSMLILTAYGIAIELVQYHIPGRGADVWDVVADVAGALTFFVLFAWWKRRWLARQRRRRLMVRN
jgi:VanZ family protein